MYHRSSSLITHHEGIFYEKDLGENQLLEVQPNLFVDEIDSASVVNQIDSVETFSGDTSRAAVLLESFHKGALMVADAVPDIVEPTPLWVEFGETSRSFYYADGTCSSRPAVGIAKQELESLIRYKEDEPLPLRDQVEPGSFDDLCYKPTELMFAAGVEEAHHAIIARYRGIRYGIGLGRVDPSAKETYLAQEVEWQAGQFVLRAMQKEGVSPRAIAAHQRRLDAALEVRRIVGLEDGLGIPYLDKFTAYHAMK